MATATATRTKKTRGSWTVKVQGQAIDQIRAARNPEWTNDPDCTKYKYLVVADDQENETDDRDEIRDMVADMIREIRANAIEAQCDRDNDELDEATEALKDSGKARKALEVLKAAGLI